MKSFRNKNLEQKRAELIEKISMNTNSPDFVKEAEESGLSPTQYLEILKLELEKIGRPSNYERVKKQRNVLSVLSAALAIALLVCVFPIGAKKYSDGYTTGYDFGYEEGVQDTKSAYSKQSNNGGVTVYITPSGTKYHEKGCPYLHDDGISISLKKAKEEGYTACSKCDPPSSSFATSANSGNSGIEKHGGFTITKMK